MSLREKATLMNSGKGIEFMTGRTKGNVSDLYNKEVVVEKFDFLTGDDGKYLVFTVKGNETEFFFGATVMTQNFEEFTNDDIIEIATAGLPILLNEKKNKKGTKTYTAITFYPTADDIKAVVDEKKTAK